MQGQIDIPSVWNKVVQDVKMKVIHPTLWRSLEASVPIAIECGWCVVGFPAGSYHMSGNLTTPQHQMAIERALLEFTGMQLKLRIIEGISTEDWEQAKTKDAHIERLRQEALKRREKEDASIQAWEDLLEQIARRYAVAPMRQLPQGKARYLRDILGRVSDVMDEVMPANGDSDELAERALARAIEKVSQMTDIPAPFVALELLRMRGE